MSRPSFQSPLFVQQPPLQKTKAERKARGWNGALRDAFMLDTSVGQFAMMKATSDAFDVPIGHLQRRIEPGYSAFDEDLTGYERFYDEFVHSTSPEETQMVKQLIDNNLDLRNTLEDYGGIRFATGLLDPVNLIPVPFGIGRGFVNGFKNALKRGAPIVAATELIRHDIDPTSTAEETLFATLGGTLFLGLMGGALGKLPAGGMTVGQALKKLTPPAGTTSMFAGVPWHLGTTKGVFKRLTESLRSTASAGEAVSKSVDPDRIKVVDDLSEAGDAAKLVEVHVDGESVMLASVKGDTFHVISIEVKQELRGNGIGTAVYKRAIQYAEDNGLKFVSDDSVSAAAARRYKGLEDEGFNVKENKDVTFDSEGTRTSNKRREPAFEILPQIDPKQIKIPKFVRENMDELAQVGRVLANQLKTINKAIVGATNALKTATTKGGWKTKRKAELKELLDTRASIEMNVRRNRSEAQDLNVAAAQMLDEATIKDWDLLPTGYNKILGKLDQFPWWVLIKTPLRELAPDLGVKYQMFALRIAATPGLNNKGNRLSATTGPSVEALSIEYTGKWLVATRRAQQIYRKYAGYGESSSQVKQFTIDTSQRVRGAVNRAMGGEKITTTADGKLTVEEFDKQITIAIANGGAHELAEISEAAAGYVRVLKEIGDEGRRLGVFATQKNIAKRIARVEKMIDEHNERWNARYGTTDKQPPPIRNMVDELELEKSQLVEMAEAFQAADNPSFVHRMWLAEEVKAKEVELKEILTREFTDNPHKGKTKVSDGKYIDNEKPEAIEARVNEAFASILRDADTGSNLDFAPKSTDKLDWLNARRDLMLAGPDASGVSTKVAEIQIAIIDRKIKRIRDGEQITGAGGPLIARRLELDDAELVNLGVIEPNVNTWMNHYVMRTAPVIETARIFGDGRAQKHIDDLVAEVFDRALKETDPKKAKALFKEAERGSVAMNDLRDIVHGLYQIPKDPAAITGRVLRMLRNFNILGAMGRSVMMALGDIGNVVVSQGLVRSMGHAVETFASGISDGNIKLIRNEVDLAGSVSEVILGQRYHQMTDFGVAVGSSTSPRLSKFERRLANASQRFFLFNLLGPWTDMARRFSGGMLQSRLIENSRLWKKGLLNKEEQKIMSRLGISKQQAIQFADEWEAAGSLKHKSMFIASTDNWISTQAVSTFRAAMNTEINRMVPTPGAVDKPKALLKSEWWKVIGQYRGFSIAATHRIMGAGIHTKGANKFSGFMSMIGIAMMVDSFKRPDYIKLPIEEQLLRAVELSAVTGIILDLNDTIERASAGTIGLRPALGMDIRERNPNWSNRMGTLGAVPNQWLTLMYGLTSDQAETDDAARAIRYMIPYNNLLWWNETFNRVQRSAVDFIEDES